ncbi:Amidohydrolase [Rubripirellula amarantea]|uniref:Amidohydrolase n=1 Tax=Rubripirellula amarantea TaxID=2527999 RepID=A0A5C5WPK8_9BACT|nr:amidohydrolase family protein [Rubripirellula amarantea]TWT52794.1 Amidohydrolase [Rubripirellula amarantea]
MKYLSIIVTRLTIGDTAGRLAILISTLFLILHGQRYRLTATVFTLCGLLALPISAQESPTVPNTVSPITPNTASVDELIERPARSQAKTPSDGMLLKDFRPESKLRVAETIMTTAKFPVVDVHTHFHYKFHDSAEAIDDFVAMMDRNNIAMCISLDGQLGGQWERHRQFLWGKHRDRFAIFLNVNWMGDGEADDPATWACHRPGFAERTATEIKEAVAQGASGLKIFKRFGLRYRNPDGSLIEINDRRWDPIWKACGEAGIPVIIHTADPVAFFEPMDEKNERYEELSRHPNWSFYGDEFPSRESLLAARNDVIGRHPETNFIGAHIANSSEDLEQASEWLERYPNLYIEPASRISELGRQPFTARKFLIRYADRLVFGTDGPWSEQRLRIYWRFFETNDEYFDYSEKLPPPQGLWKIYGVDLPDDVLRKLYHENAAKLIPGVAERLEKYRDSESDRMKEIKN